MKDITKKFNFLSNRSGQGIVEYILLLVVVLSIAYALLNQLVTPFKNWTDFYLGQYVECLLDQGELPSLGGDSEVTDCNYSSLTDNSKQNNNNNNSSNGQSNSEDKKSDSNKDSSNSQDQSSQDSTNRGQNKKQLSYRAGTRSYGGGDSSSSYASNKKINLTSSSDTAEGELGSESSNSDSNSSSSYRGRNNYFNNRVKIRRIKGLSGQIDEEDSKMIKQKKKSKKQQANKSNLEEEETQTNANQKKFSFKPSQSKAKKVNQSEDNWSFLGLFKSAFIIIIIIALIWFVFLQIAQITRSMEK